MNTVGEPYVGQPHARFDEGRPLRHLAGAAAYSTIELDGLLPLWEAKVNPNGRLARGQAMLAWRLGGVAGSLC